MEQMEKAMLGGFRRVGMGCAGLLLCTLIAAGLRGDEPGGEVAALSKAIDAEIEAGLVEQNLTAAPRAGEAALVRRVYLDLVGRIPTAEETRAFLDDSDANKAHGLIDRLLDDGEMSFYWARVLNGWLNGPLTEPPHGMDEFVAWLEAGLDEGRGWDELAREMLLPDAEDPEQRAAAYFLASRLEGNDRQEQLDEMTTAVASVYFGVQLQCAKCHDHPFVGDWKQDHYYGLAAFLGRTERTKYEDATVLAERADGEVEFNTVEGEKKVAELLFLDGTEIEEPPLPEDREEWYLVPRSAKKPAVPKFSRRAGLAEVGITPESPYFKRALVNRVWKRLVGRGLVEPVDQIHDANPATHPVLLARLSDDFAEHGFDLRRLIGGIMHSETYLRSSRWSGAGERPADRHYAVAILKPLSPRQLTHSVAQAAGYLDVLGEKYEREKEKRKLDEVTTAAVRRLFEREREYGEFVERFGNDGETFEANASQALFLVYNDVIERFLRPSPGSLVAELAKLEDEGEAARRACLTVLSRPASEEEVDDIAALLKATESRPVEERWETVVRALVSSAEFRFNH